MKVDDVQCYRYDIFLENIYDIPHGYECHSLTEIRETIDNLMGVSPNKSMVYIDLMDVFQKQYMNSQLFSMKMYELFNHVEPVHIHPKLDSYYVYSKDGKDKALLTFFHIQHAQAKLFFVGDDIMVLFDDILNLLNDHICLDVKMYLQNICMIKEFHFLHNSPPYFKIERSSDIKEQGEFITIGRTDNKIKYTELCEEHTIQDTYDNEIEVMTLRILDDRFYRYIKIVPIVVYSYAYNGTEVIFKVS